VIDPGLDDWRLLLHRLHATFRAPSVADAASFVHRLASTVDADLDFRPSGVVHVTVAHDDVDTARTISAVATEYGLASEPPAATALEVAIDALDIAAVRPFWRAVLGYVDDGDDALADPERIGPTFWFQQMDEPRPQRNRLHIDVTVPHDVAEARIEAALAAGGTLVSDEAARSFWILADPEGNEACICTWQDRG
jgi:4a-hydroxytetrahydrobiopterin dehydratase